MNLLGRIDATELDPIVLPEHLERDRETLPFPARIPSQIGQGDTCHEGQIVGVARFDGLERRSVGRHEVQPPLDDRNRVRLALGNFDADPIGQPAPHLGLDDPGVTQQIPFGPVDVDSKEVLAAMDPCELGDPGVAEMKGAFDLDAGNGEGRRVALDWGLQPFSIGASQVFVTPSPSPANAVYALEDLAEWMRRLAALRARL